MREEEVETAIKVVVVGNGAVGKSSLIQRYCKGIFTRDYKKTIGVDFLERQIEVNCEDVRLMLWDTAGQEEFDAITKAYYRGAQACVIAYSTIDQDSYNAVLHWKNKVEEEVGRIPSVLVENKVDLVSEAAVTKEDGEKLAKQLGLRFFRTSVKDNTNIEQVFRYLAEQYLAQMSTADNTIAVQKIAPNIFTSTNTCNNANNHVAKKDNGIIQLHPTRRRTHGKKRVLQRCRIL